MTPRLVLIGPPGAGKTTVGKLVAAHLGVDFRDTDADVEAAAGKPIADIFITDGEPEFRALERAAVLAALDAHRGVLALGGGAVLDAEVRTRLRSHRVVFLDVDLPTAAGRVGINRDRPLLLGNPRAQLRQLLAERRPHYTEVASVTVPTDELTPEQVADAVVQTL